MADKKYQNKQQGEEKPPIFCNNDAEQAVIGGIINESSAFGLVTFLRPEMFCSDKHTAIFTAVQQIYDNGGKIDYVTVADQIEKNGMLEIVGGKYALVELSLKVSSTAHIESHACIIQDEYYRRKIYMVGERAKALSLNRSEDVGDVIDKMSLEVENISQDAYNLDENTSVSQTAEDSYNRYFEREKAANNGSITGVETGFSILNKISFGYQPGNLIILAARPAMGKTAVMLHKAKAAAISGKIPVIFSLEMSKEDLTDRLVLSECNVNSIAFKNGTLSNHEVEEMCTGADRVLKLNIQINDNSNQTVRKIKNISKQLIKQGKCNVIYIDYLQLLDMKNDNRSYNREQEVSQTSRALKLMAKELGVPVIALSQLSRTCEDRADKRPRLSDLRESGAIEQDADIVEFLWRPEYYNIDEYERQNTKGLLILDIAKGRGMPTCEIEFKHNGQMSKFYDKHEDKPF